MYAIIKTGGKQYKVAEGDVIMVEKLSAAEGEAVVFDEVLTVVNDGDVKVGTRRFWSSSTRLRATTVNVRVIVSRSRRLLSKRLRLND